MKKWSTPVLYELNFSETAVVGAENALSGTTPQVDLGTCHNPYWEGNGLSKEEALENNPFWSGSWGGN